MLCDPSEDGIKRCDDSPALHSGKGRAVHFLYTGARHIGAMAECAEAMDQKLPISISIGVDPAIEIGSCFEAPTTPLGYDELAVAGALRGRPVELCPCLTVKERAIANAEYVIEGEVLPHVRVQEDQNRHTGYAMPEFPGYTGPAQQSVLADQGDSGDAPEKSDYADLYRTQRGACIHGGNSHGGQHLRNGRKGHARPAEKCVLRQRRRRKIHGSPAVPEAFPQ